MTAIAPEVDYPKDVLEFAEDHKIRGILVELRDAIQKLFPNAHIETSVEADPELPITQIIFDIDVRMSDVPDYLKATHAMGEEVFRLIPHFAQELFNFRLSRRP